MECQFDDLLGRFCYKNQCYTNITTSQPRVTRRVNPKTPICGSGPIFSFSAGAASVLLTYDTAIQTAILSGTVEKDVMPSTAKFHNFQ